MAPSPASERLDEYARRWHVSVTSLTKTETSLIAFGERDGQHIVLKVAPSALRRRRPAVGCNGRPERRTPSGARRVVCRVDIIGRGIHSAAGGRVDAG